MKDVNLGKTQSWHLHWHADLSYILPDDTNIAGDIPYRFGAIWLISQLCSCNIEILNHLYLFNEDGAWWWDSHQNNAHSVYVLMSKLLVKPFGGLALF